MKSERLCGSGLDDFPNVDTHSQTKQLELIDQSDIHAAINIFKQLRHLRSSGRRDWDGAVEDGAIKSSRDFGCLRVQATNNFGDIAAGEAGIDRVFALGRECHPAFIAS